MSDPQIWTTTMALSQRTALSRTRAPRSRIPGRAEGGDRLELRADAVDCGLDHLHVVLGVTAARKASQRKRQSCSFRRRSWAISSTTLSQPWRVSIHRIVGPPSSSNQTLRLTSDRVSGSGEGRSRSRARQKVLTGSQQRCGVVQMGERDQNRERKRRSHLGRETEAPLVGHRWR